MAKTPGTVRSQGRFDSVRSALVLAPRPEEDSNHEGHEGHEEKREERVDRSLLREHFFVGFVIFVVQQV
jgi:hypothetical protein